MKKTIIGLVLLSSISTYANEVKVLRLEKGTSVTQDDISLKQGAEGYYESGSILTHGVDTQNDEVKVQCHVTPSNEIGFLFFNQDKDKALLSLKTCKELSAKVRADGVTNIVVEKVIVGKGRNTSSHWKFVGVDKH